MPEDQLLEQKINECRERHKRLSDTIQGLQKEYDNETRFEEKQRIGARLHEREQERQVIEKEWQLLEAEQAKSVRQHLTQEARDLERKKAFREAISVWEQIRDLTPDDPKVVDEIRRLEDRRQQSQRLTDYIRQLTGRLAIIRSIYPMVITRLRQMSEMDVVDEAIVNIVDDFLRDKLSADDFTAAWQALTITGAIEELNYRSLADRLKRGEIVLFLGSDIPHLLNISAPIPEAMGPELAKQINYEGAIGSLSMIAEYYQMKPEYGRSSLVRNLKTIIGNATPDISLYQLLVKIEQPLVIISTNYDMFLEKHLQQSGRKYALVSSVICGEQDCEIGSVVIYYSDRDAPELLRMEQDLSSLRLIEDGYFLIYKICGYCNNLVGKTAYQHRILTLAEENYFTFARHMDRLIPNYVVKQFATRGLFFLGYSPRSWEERLLVNAILDKRHHQQCEPAHVITQDTDPFVRAYWNSRSVHRYEIALQEFVRGLEAYLG